MDYDKTGIPENYDQGRDHGPEFLSQWMEIVAANLGERRVRTVLDLGCGTGRFAQGLASQLRATVIGLDPSRKMLAQARRNLKREDVFYVCGSAEDLPLRPESVDVVFISMAVHHFVNPQQAAMECRRVMRAKGRLYLRTGSRDQIPNYPYVPYFPAGHRLLERRLPPLESQRAWFEMASLRMRLSMLVTQQVAADYEEYARKLATKSDSILASLSNADFEAGLSALRAAKPAGPVTEPIDFVIFEKD